MGKDLFRGQRGFQFVFLLGLIIILGLTAYGIQRVIAAPVFQIKVDDQGADDYPGQKDLNFLQIGIDPLVPNTLYVNWGLDNTDWTGQNTGDVCVLFDSNGNGTADYSFCATVSGANAILSNIQLYSCGDSAQDKCTNPRAPIPFSSDALLEIAEVDPFGVPSSPYYDPLHVTGNTCSFNVDPQNCYTFDTYVQSTILGTDFPLGAVPELINVCSYPSAIPGSAPSDCVFLPGAGFLKIEKVSNPDLSTPFVFNLGAGQSSANGTTSWTINGTGSTSEYISFEPGVYDLSEIIPTGWVLESASCSINDAASTPTGTWDNIATINDISIQTGLRTTCLFTNTGAVDVTVAKTDYDYSRTAPYPIYPYRGSLLPYEITVTNKDMPVDTPAQGVTVTDNLDANVIVNEPLVSIINPATDYVGTTRSCQYDSINHQVNCDLGIMAPLEVVTIKFDVTVGPNAPTMYLVEMGECTQGTPNMQGDVPVDVCNVVTVSASNELPIYQGDNSASEPTDIGLPTAVAISFFTATGEADGIRIDWGTEMETFNLGFNLYRAPSLHAPKTKVNEGLILGNPGGMGGTYTYLDQVKSRNTFFYWIESVDLSENALLHEYYASARLLKKIK